MQVKMQVKWGKLAAKVMVWLASEMLLNLVGLDNLANYGEFVFGDLTLAQLSSGVQGVQIGLVLAPTPTSFPFQ